MASASRRHFADPHMLLKMEYNNTSTHTCDICRSKMAGLIGYRCSASACNFDVHEACADYFKETISFFAHPWHTLTLTRMPSSCVGWICDLCREGCPPGDFVYRCVRCMFDVHPLCTMLPQTMRSPLHPEHDLCMVPATAGISCSVCSKGLHLWQYRCGFCHLKLHITCVSAAPNNGDQSTASGQSNTSCGHANGNHAGQTSTAAAAAAATTTAQGSSTTSQTTSSGQSFAVGPRSSRSSAVAKFLLKTSLHVAINAATGGLASPVLEILSLAFG